MMPVSRGDTLPASSPDAVARVRALERRLREQPQVQIETRHVLHAGVYSRTIWMQAGTVLTGALIKRATQLIVCGHVTVYVGDESRELTGYHVLAASAGRKTAFMAHADTWLTMLFACDAQSVAAAEDQFTDEAEALLSRAVPESNIVLITGE